MTKQELTAEIFRKKSMLCVGLDTDVKLIPQHFLKYADPVFEFNKVIIDVTHDLAVAYKPNIAFYEALGINGWKSLEKTIRYLKSSYPECFIIADAKRGDIENTSALYARAFFEWLCFDAITVAPYMGKDSIVPFLLFPQKWVILLCLTSNSGSSDFQLEPSGNMLLYQQVVRKAMEWSNAEKMMFVVGATQPERILEIREMAKEYFFLVPGIGTQGGNIENVCKNGMNNSGGLLINISRSILYASNTEDLATAARDVAMQAKLTMQKFLFSLVSY
jgi:orotidine-5'-phosphate decarboxylase